MDPPRLADSRARILGIDGNNNPASYSVFQHLVTRKILSPVASDRTETNDSPDSPRYSWE